MKTTLEDMKARRSCRAYKPEQITEEELDAVLEAGTYAPTGRGKQAPILVAVQDPEMVKKLSQLNAGIMGNSGDPFYGAPTVIVVLADRSVGTHLYDGSCVMANLLNAANALGLGSCWIHRAREVFDSDEGKALLQEWGIEGDYEGIGNCILGYKAREDAPAAPRKDGYIIKIK